MAHPSSRQGSPASATGRSGDDCYRVVLPSAHAGSSHFCRRLELGSPMCGRGRFGGPTGAASAVAAGRSRPWRHPPTQRLADCAGRATPAIGDLPLAMVLSPDGHSLIVTNNGYQRPTIRVVDLDAARSTGVITSMTRGWGWRGARTARRSIRPAQRRTRCRRCRGRTGGCARARRSPCRIPGTAPARGDPASGRAPDLRRRDRGESDGSQLFAVHVFGQLLTSVDLTTGAVAATVKLAAEPYTCVLSPDG